jgi:hypothetical protein
MKIIATSDLHGNLPEVPECDILILAGDICPDFAAGGLDTSGVGQGEWLDTTFREWLEPISKRCNVIATWGNHDFVGEHPSLVPDLPWILLVDDSVVIDKLKIHATPWCPNLPFWAFFASDRALEYRADSIPEDTDIWSHIRLPTG